MLQSQYGELLPATTLHQRRLSKKQVRRFFFVAAEEMEAIFVTVSHRAVVARTVVQDEDATVAEIISGNTLVKTRQRPIGETNAPTAVRAIIIVAPAAVTKVGNRSTTVSILISV